METPTDNLIAETIEENGEKTAKTLDKMTKAELIEALQAAQASAPAAPAEPITNPSDARRRERPATKKIKLFKDGDKYKDDVFVCINGRTWQIQRGVEVEVPYNVAMVIERSIEQDRAASETKDRFAAAARF